MEPLLHHFRVHSPVQIADTILATVWKVTRSDGTAATLKIYKAGTAGEEAAGFDLLRAWDGRGAARLLGRAKGAALLEWLEGPSLGDLVRAGQDDTATRSLADVAKQLHLTELTAATALQPLTDRFAALMTARIAPTCPDTTRATIRKAQRIADHLLRTQSDIRPLHGDLHHDNIKDSARGYLAFDAKGIVGERGYDFANALRNPVGAEEHYRAPDVIMRRTRLWAKHCDLSETRLLQWAAAHSALSLAWSNNGLFGTDSPADIALINSFLRLAA